MGKIMRILTVALLVSAALWNNALAADINLPPAVSKAVESRVIIMIYSSDDNELLEFGSGFVVKPGYIITTAHHFIPSVSPLLTSLIDKVVIKVGINISSELTKAEIIEIWLLNDIALLKVEEPEKIGSPVKFAESFPSDGETVYAAGFGFKGEFKTTFQATTLGKINSVSYNGYLVEYVAVIDRLLLRGFSGGPAFNQKGELAGMNLCATPEGISGILTIYPIKYLLKDVE